MSMYVIMKKVVRIFQVVVILFASLLLASCDTYLEVTLDPKENIIVEEGVNLRAILKDTVITLRVFPQMENKLTSLQ